MNGKSINCHRILKLGCRLVILSSLLTLAFFAFWFALAQNRQDVFAVDDPRQFNHGIVTLPFTQDKELVWYATWASASSPWEHDIYRQTLHFENNVLLPDIAPQRYIGNGSDEAQEPVSAAIAQNIILTAWEDGSGDSVDVRGQLHRPDGSVIKDNWLVAGGEGAQHSASVSHINGGFLVFFADEAPPAQYAMVKARVINDQNGTLLKTLTLTAPKADNWWPVSTDNGNNHAFAGWGNGDTFFGVVLSSASGNFTHTTAYTYISGIAQYHYHVAWLKTLNRFIIIAKTGQTSTACLVDLRGKAAPCVDNLPPIIREANMAVKDTTIVYPTGERDVAILQARANTITHIFTLLGDIHLQLKSITWPSTGVWARFIQDANNTNNQAILFAMNDNTSNDALFLTVDANFIRYPVYLPVIILTKKPAT